MNALQQGQHFIIESEEQPATEWIATKDPVEIQE